MTLRPFRCSVSLGAGYIHESRAGFARLVPVLIRVSRTPRRGSLCDFERRRPFFLQTFSWNAIDERFVFVSKPPFSCAHAQDEMRMIRAVAASFLVLPERLCARVACGPICEARRKARAVRERERARASARASPLLARVRRRSRREATRPAYPRDLRDVSRLREVSNRRAPLFPRRRELWTLSLGPHFFKKKKN